MTRYESFSVKTKPFMIDGERQFVTVEERIGTQLLARRRCDSSAVLEYVDCATTSYGCEITEIAASPSGRWLVTQRCSGQGEWGYDVFDSRPLARRAGIAEARGYMLDLPEFSADETRLVGGFGESWLGGWWSPEGDPEEPARRGRISFGFLFVHRLPDHYVERHELVMDLPAGWLPDDVEAETWLGARHITPAGSGVRLMLPGGIWFESEGPLTRTILLPTPDPRGGTLLRG